ncbi:rhodanese-like domain-containing protein [Sneathiella glossodoripedis]|uniref:rhodanese-like domain-containing protein n=1 Tax=Sneathiella glossodoripedis TaxID=418853 RepID=UPI0004708A21|nr:rhodanese-like domain-containing protein [Sneathiella glossodoripedis]
MTTTGTHTANSQYAGDVTPQQAWEMLQDQAGAVLVDVRTNAEWAYVGLPDLYSIGKKCELNSWVLFPQMAPNPNFLPLLNEIQPDKSQPVLFLCRSGVRSVAAAIAATSAGFENCFNILEGFEGDPDSEGHRGKICGWKVRNLDWKQG